jgi:hypothetical protein
MSSIRSPTKTIVISGTPSGTNYWNLSGNNINNNNSGVVGINTSNPDISYSLDVSGSANIRGNLVVNGSPVSGPSYTYSREHYFISQTAGVFPYNSLLPLTFFQRIDGTTSPAGMVIGGVQPDASINLLALFPNTNNGGVAFICPTTLSKITGSINFGFRDTSANDISLNIYKTSITNAYTSFATGATLLSSSRFIYTPNTVANITVPVNVTSAGLTNNDIVYVGFQMLPGSPSAGNCRFAMRYTLGFS